MTTIWRQKGLLNPEAKYLSIQEIGQLFSPPVSHVSLSKWQRQGKLRLNPIVLGNKKFYNREEVITEIERNKQHLYEELD